MKRSNKKGWEELVKSRFQDFEESPEDHLWSNIRQNIQPEPKWSLWPAANILLLLIGAGMAFLFLQEPLKVGKSSNLPANNSKAILTDDEPDSEKSPLSKAKTNEDENNRMKGETLHSGKQESKISYNIGLQQEENLKRNAVPPQDSVGPQEKRPEATSLLKEENEQNKPDFKEQELIPSPKPPTAPIVSTFKPSLEPSRHSATGGAGPGETETSKEKLLSIRPKKRTWLGGITDSHLRKDVIEPLPLKRPEELAVAESTAPQEEKMKIIKEKEKAGLEIWGTLTPMLTYRQVKPNRKDDIQMLALEENQAFSMNRVGLQTSVGFSYFLTPKLAIKAGAFHRFTQNKWSYSYFSGNPDSLVVEQLNENTITTQPVFTRSTEKVNEIKQYFGALVGIQFSTPGPIRKIVNLEFQASGGPTHDHLLYFIAFDIDLEKHLFKQIYLNAGPSFIWELNSFSPKEVQHYEVKPYGLGLKLGVSYKLNR